MSIRVGGLSKAVGDGTYPQVVNVLGLGVRGDGRRVLDAAITSGAAVLTSATALFTSSDVGKLVTVTGAGAAGAALCTTVVGFTNTTTVTLAAIAGTTVAGATSVIGTDDTTAHDAAQAAASLSGRVLYHPPAIYCRTTGVTLNRRGQQMRGENVLLTEIHICSTTADGVVVTTSSDSDPMFNSTNPNYVCAEGFRISGPSISTASSSSGVGFRAQASTSTHNGDFLRLDLVISGFATGCLLDGWSNVEGRVLSELCGVGNNIAGVASFQNNNRLTLGASRNTTVGTIFGPGNAGVFRLIDHVTQPIGIQALNQAQVVLEGGEFEQLTGAGSYFVDVQAGANVTMIGPAFTKATGNNGVAAQVAASGALTIISPSWDTTMGNTLVTKLGISALVTVLGQPTDNTLSTALRINENGTQTYPPTPLPVVADNSVPAAGANYRGRVIQQMSRDSASVKDQLWWYMRDDLGNYFKRLLSFAYSGSVDPNGAQVGFVGDVYVQYGGALGTTLWTKESGTGNTGWAPVGTRRPQSVKTANYTLGTADYRVIFNAGGVVAATLPAPSSGNTGREYEVVNISASSLTVNATTGLINGAASISLAQYKSAKLFNNGTDYFASLSG